MSTTLSTVVGAGLVFLFIFLSGIWLGRSGRPFNNIVLTFHKLISLAAAVALVVILYQANRVAALSAMGLAAGVVAGLLFLGTGICGGLLSTDKPMPTLVSTIHRIAPALTALSTAVTLWVLLGR